MERKRHENLIAFSRKLHEYIRDYAKLAEAEKPLIVSGVLIALSDNAFSRSYRNFAPKDLPRELLAAIRRQIEEADIPKAKKQNIVQPYSFLTAHPELEKINVHTKENPLYRIIADIESSVMPFINDHENYDVIGQFYAEFLRYAGGDASLGIVLTPKHICELFAKLADLTPQSTVLDICAGTGGFLIAAMIEMVQKAKSDEERRRIKREGLIGVENQPKMFSLAASNMLLRGDGKANLHQGSCFDEAIGKAVKAHKASVGMMNPPFSQKGEGVSELDFILQMLDCLDTGATGIVITMMSCAIQPHKLREAILARHRLDAVMSMPDDLFYPVGAVTCIMVFTAHIPHEANPHHKSWFGYWKNDGFQKVKNQGRMDVKQQWRDTEAKWLSAFFNREEIPGFSVKRKVSANDEWCAEAYMETDYSTITADDFITALKKYQVFRLLNDDLLAKNDTNKQNF